MNKKSISIALGVALIFVSTTYNYAYFRENLYQDNIIKIETPPIIEDNKSSFETTAYVGGIYFNEIIINLEQYFDIKSNFKLSIETKYGIFENKFFTITNKVGTGVSIYLTLGNEFELRDFENESPTQNKLDVIIKYKEENEILERKYTVEFLADPNDTNTLKVYFYN